MKAAHDIDLLEQYWLEESRNNFYAYRQFIGYSDFIKGWFQEELSVALQNFYIDLRDYKKPILIIEAPPQHGKSRAVTEFLSWLIGKMPDMEMIYASYSDRLGVRANRSLQRTLDSEKYQKIFNGEVRLGGTQVVTLANRVLRNNEIFEIQDHRGSFRNTTVNGAVTGEGLSLGVIDDAVKGRAEANSKTIQEKTWDWFTDDFYTRFSENAGLLIIMTRWNVADLAGRLTEADKNIKVITYKAIAETDEKNRKEGDPLFPEHKSLEFLLKRKNKMSPHNWSSLYQQYPVLVSGNIFKFHHWKWWKVLPKLKWKFIVADTAQKKNNWNDPTVFQCWGYGVDNNIYLLDMIRKRMESPELRKQAKLFYIKHDTPRIEEDDPILRGMWIEDKSSGIGLIQELKNDQLKINAIPRNVDKVERAMDASPYIEAGRVYLNERVRDVGYITDEGTVFPNGIHDDSIDDTMNAIEVAFIHREKEIFIS